MYVPSGITIPANGQFRVRLSGAVTVTPNPQHQIEFPEFTDYAKVGAWGPAGTGEALGTIGSARDVALLEQIASGGGQGTGRPSMSERTAARGAVAKLARK